MARRLIMVWAVLVAALCSLEVAALGLSNIDVVSKLNEPLNAKVNIFSIPRGDVNNLKVSLAPSEAFRRAGLEFPAILNTLRFEIQTADDRSTQAVLHITTRQPLKEPFLNFLIEINWPSGKIRREYTALLDPPLHEARVAEAITIASATPSQTKPATTTSRHQPSTTPTPASQNYTVSSGDTLSTIARRTYTDKSISFNQHMQNIYRNNSHAFIRNNMNLIRAGAVLRIPAASGSAPPVPTTALAAATVTTNVTPQESTTTQDRLTALSEPAQPRLRLASAPEGQDNETNPTTPRADAPQQNAISGELRSLRSQLKTLEEENLSIREENRGLKSRLDQTTDLVTTMKKQLDELKRLVELQNAELANLQNRLRDGSLIARTEAPTPPPVTQSETVPETAPEIAPETAPETVVVVDADPIASEEQFRAETERMAGLESESADVTDVTDEFTPEEQATLDTEVAEEVDAEALAAMEEYFGKEEQVADTDIMSTLNRVGGDFIKTANETVEEVPGGWMSVGGAVGGLFLLLLLLMFFMGRKRKPDPDQEEAEIQAAMQRLEEEERLSSDADDNKSDHSDADLDALMNKIERENQDNVDLDTEILEEVEVYLAYENYDQAIELLDKEIAKYPERSEYRVKMLEVLAAANRPTEFERHAVILRDQVNAQGPHWDKTVRLWTDMGTGRELLAKDDSSSNTAAIAGAAALGAVGGAVAASALSDSDEDDEIANLLAQIDTGDSGDSDISSVLSALDDADSIDTDELPDADEEDSLLASLHGEDTSISSDELDLSDDLSMSDDLNDDLSMTDDLGDDLSMSDDLNDDLSMSDDLGDDLSMSDDLGDDLSMSDDLGDDLSMTDDLGDDLSMSDDLGDDLSMSDDLGDDLSMSDDLNDDLSMTDDLGDDLSMTDDLGDDLSMADDSSDDLSMSDDLGDDLSMSDDLGDDLSMSDDLGDDLSMADDSSDDLSMSDDLGDDLSMTDDLGDDLSMADDSSDDLSMSDDLGDDLSMTDDLGDDLSMTDDLAMI
jgi:pilus assembly protein FimV